MPKRTDQGRPTVGPVQILGPKSSVRAKSPLFLQLPTLPALAHSDIDPEKEDELQTYKTSESTSTFLQQHIILSANLQFRSQLNFYCIRESHQRIQRSNYHHFRLQQPGNCSAILYLTERKHAAEAHHGSSRRPAGQRRHVGGPNPVRTANEAGISHYCKALASQGF